MKIKDSLTGEIKEFAPLKPPKVNIYTCGVTVYDECHIGHARSLYVFDVIRRYLEYRKFKVNFVRNITDIDDKIINRANELKIDWKELVSKYIDRYKEDLKSLNINFGILDKDGEEPRATKNVEDIKKYIKELIRKEYAYATDSGVYFSVRKFKDYGKLSGQSIEQMLTGVRKESDETKKDPLDFALWKKAKPGEPSWPSDWGDGRPGWHIECSVMSQKYLKTDTLDIHAGGRDLIFPHHENEIAQSEAKTGKPFAKYWMHHGLLTINEQKMAKSAGNFITIKDVLNKHHPDVLKLFFLRGHYSHPIDYSEDKMEYEKIAYKGFVHIFYSNKERIKNIHRQPGLTSKKEIDSFKKRFEEAMDDDFNMPRALAALFGLKTYCNNILTDYHDENGPKLKYAMELIRKLADILGLSPDKADPANDQRLFDKELRDTVRDVIKETEEINRLINERNRLRAEKKYSEADKRRKILEKRVILKDRKDGTTEWIWR